MALFFSLSTTRVGYQEPIFDAQQQSQYLRSLQLSGEPLLELSVAELSWGNKLLGLAGRSTHPQVTTATAPGILKSVSAALSAGFRTLLR